MTRGRSARIVLLALGLSASGGCSTNFSLGGVEATSNRSGAAMIYADDRTTVEVVSTQVGGKNIYIPGTIVLTEGTGRVLSVYNTTDGPHGFKIAGLGIEEILPPGEEHRIELPPLSGGRVYDVQCHLHPPHRGGTLVVLPGR